MFGLKKRLCAVLEPADEHLAPLGAWINRFLLVLIILNILAAVLETVGGLYSRYGSIFQWFEGVSIGLFTVEYALRLWVCTEKAEYSLPVTGRLGYIFSFFSLIDLAVILPFYLPMVFAFDLRFLRILRIFRMLRVLKLARYMKALHFLLDVIRDKKRELYVAFSFLIILLVIASALIFYAEHNAQPDKFSSIPESMWWGVVTLTTVGYGDVYPITPFGKVISAIIAILGVGLFALPTGILAAGIMESVQKKHKTVCPHCGEEL